jgi:hypothetical protein
MPPTWQSIFRRRAIPAGLGAAPGGVLAPVSRRIGRPRHHSRRVAIAIHIFGKLELPFDARQLECGPLQLRPPESGDRNAARAERRSLQDSSACRMTRRVSLSNRVMSHGFGGILCNVSLVECCRP